MAMNGFINFVLILSQNMICMQMRYTFLVIVQIILILYFQKVLEYVAPPQICH